MTLTHTLEQWLTAKEHHVIVTGLSRSGKSTLLTSLMAQLSQRHQTDTPYDSLPLLSVLPSERVMNVELINGQQEAPFPYTDNLNALKNRHWPSQTRQISAFTLVVTLRRRSNLLQKLLGNEQLRLMVHDYPGEWLMDLSMIGQSYTDWSAHAFAQQTSEPQLSLAKQWHHVVHEMDFDLPPLPLYTDHLIAQYLAYLKAAKTDGITRLQPGALLLPPPQAHLGQFCPLPAKVTAQPNHPWVQFFEARYNAFIEQWAIPLRDNYFRHADKQLILIDLLEGLNYGKAYLAEMQEAISHLMASFVYGKRRWYERLHQPLSINHVIFAASKVDLIPLQEQANALALLKQLTAGAVAQLNQHAMQIDHLLLSAIIATKPDQDPHSLIYKHVSGETRKVTFDPIPKRIQDLDARGIYPFLHSLPPKIERETDIRSMHLDQLMNRLLKE